MIAFIGVCWWAYAPSRKKRFSDDANLPFADEQKHQQAQAETDSRAKTDVTNKQAGLSYEYILECLDYWLNNN